jgi:release factor glutamine methyltransferase
MTDLYDVSEIETLFFMGFETLFGKKKIDFVLHPNETLSDENLQKWNQFLSKLMQGKPIQYILGTTEFYGLPFIVNENVLIPRPETEELIDCILEDYQQKDEISILDIGSGSGCIPIVLNAKMPLAKIVSWDVSEKALETAQKNNQLNKTNVAFELQDILKVENIPFSVDVIVSNPPYVQITEQAEMKKNVLDFEPHLALFVPENDPLLFYRKIGTLAWQHLNENGALYFEINQYLGNETMELLRAIGFQNLELRKDFMKNDRMIKAVK